MKFNKKILSIFFIALFAVVLVACGGTTTQAPTTQTPTTQAPTTQAPTTQAPTTQAPTTQPPTTQEPTTQEPTTQPPTTQEPTTQPPTTETPVVWTPIVAALKDYYSATLDNDDFVAEDDITLITAIMDASIAWSSSNLSLLANDGTVTRPSFSLGDQTVILTATLSIGAQYTEVMFFVTIGAAEKTDQERANEVFLVVTAFPFKEKWTSADNNSLTFLSEGKDADDVVYAVVWTSSHPEVMVLTGENIQIVQDDEVDIVVTMTATIMINDVEYSKAVNFTIAKMEEGEEVDTIAEALALGAEAYVNILGVTIIAKDADGNPFFTDGTDILYIYMPTFQYVVGGVYDITGLVAYYYNAPQLVGSDTHPLRALPSEAPVSQHPVNEVDSIIDIITNTTTPTAQNPFEFKAYRVEVAVYYDSTWDNYSTFVVPADYDFDVPLAAGAKQPNGDSILIYYKSDATVLQAFHGQVITIEILMVGWRTDLSVWYADFFGTAADVEISIEDDQEAVDTALGALSFPATITADTTLLFPANLYGVSLTYESNNAAINVETGFVDAASQTDQITVTITVSAARGDATEERVINIKVGELPVSTIAEALAAANTTLLRVQGLVIDFHRGTVYIQDATGNISLFSTMNSATDLLLMENLGNVVEITGTRDTYNGLNQIRVQTVVYVEDGVLPTPTNLDHLVMNNANLLPYQSQIIELTGMVISARAVDSNGNITLTLTNPRNGSTVSARWDSRTTLPTQLNTLLANSQVNDIVNIVAVLSWFNNPQITIGVNTTMTTPTQAQLIAFDADLIHLTHETTSGATETVPLVGPYGATIVWDMDEIVAAGGTFNAATGEVVFPAVEETTVYNVTATLSLGDEDDVVIDVEVTVIAMTEAQKLAGAQDALTINEAAMTYDVVTLPLAGLYGTTIAWELVSGNAVLDVDGTNLTYGYDAVAFDVVLLATISLGTEDPVTKQFTVAVTPITIITDFSTIPAIADGTPVFVQGVVTGISFDGAFLQDENGKGFFLHRPNNKAALKIGDEVLYKGNIGSYLGAKQLAEAGSLYMLLVSEDNELIYNVVTADQIAAFAMGDAGALYSYTGFTFQGFLTDTRHMVLGYTKADLTTGTVTVRFYANWADLVWVAQNLEVGDALPAVEFIVYNYRDATVQLDVVHIPAIGQSMEDFENTIIDALAYEYSPVYVPHFEVRTLDGNVLHAEYLQSALLAANPADLYQGIVFDLARFLGALYRVEGSVVAIEYDRVLFTWDDENGLIGSNWVNALDQTLVGVIVADFMLGEIEDGIVVTLFDDADFEYDFELTFEVEMDLDAVIEANIEAALVYEYDPVYVPHFETSVYADHKLTTVYLEENLSVDLHEIMWDMARFLGSLYRAEDSVVTSLIYKGVEYTWDESVGLLGSNWVYVDESGEEPVTITLVSVIVADFGAEVITDTVDMILVDGTGHQLAIQLILEIVEEVAVPTEQVAYSTGFEAADGFTAGTVYNNNLESLSGPASFQWATRYGTPSTTAAIIDSQSMQMRWYTTAETTLGYTQTNFDTADVTKIVFAAANTLGLNVEVSISVDGGTTWIEGQIFILTGSSVEYTYNVPELYQTGNVRVRFTVSLPDPIPTGTARLYIDNVSIYGMR